MLPRTTPRTFSFSSAACRVSRSDGEAVVGFPLPAKAGSPQPGLLMAVRKRRTEVDAHFGPIVEDAQRRGLEVRLLRRMIEMIHELEDGRRSFSSANLDELADASSARR